MAQVIPAAITIVKTVRASRLFIAPLLQLLALPVNKRKGKDPRNRFQIGAKLLYDANRWRDSTTQQGVATAFLQYHAAIEALSNDPDMEFTFSDLTDEMFIETLEELRPVYAKLFGFNEGGLGSIVELEREKEAYVRLSEQYDELLKTHNETSNELHKLTVKHDSLLSMLERESSLANGRVPQIPATEISTTAEPPGQGEEAEEKVSNDPFGSLF